MNRFILLSLCCLSFFRAHANSSTAGYSNEGLQLRKTERIRMAREDLFLSTKEIRVHYVFENLTREPIETLVAFPFPKMDMLPETDTSKASNFKLQVGGKAQSTKREVVYTVRGKEYRDKAKARKRMEAERENEEVAELPWAFEQEFQVWTQRFPAGERLEMDISYKPSVGHGMGWRKDNTYESDPVRERYCIDASTRKALEKALGGPDAPLEGIGSAQHELSYVLVTGNNWAGPIGEFHLVLEKPDPKAIMSLCLDGLKKTSPTRFELNREDYRPERDLDVLYLHP